MVKLYRYSCWWEDAVSKCDWESFEVAILSTPKIVYTEGYLIHKSKDCHIFSMSFLGTEIGEQMIVPTRSIKKLVKHKNSKIILEEISYATFKN
mgnify:FL=1|jgi:hypothetical protein|tara:strand:- start:660 stop:941 length:282 start_codon:yes stop_codon:yes gene_type:complete